MCFSRPLNCVAAIGKRCVAIQRTVVLKILILAEAVQLEVNVEVCMLRLLNI